MDSSAISAITALVAVVVGPAVSVYVAKRQINARVISTNRQQWINALRNDISLFAKEVRLFVVAHKSGVIDNQEAYKRYEGLTLLQERINLMLNPREKEHNELVHLLTSARNCVVETIRSDNVDEEELGSHAKAISEHVQTILKSEWERVKRGN